MLLSKRERDAALVFLGTGKLMVECSLSALGCQVWGKECLRRLSLVCGSLREVAVILGNVFGILGLVQNLRRILSVLNSRMYW